MLETSDPPGLHLDAQTSKTCHATRYRGGVVLVLVRLWVRSIVDVIDPNIEHAHQHGELCAAGAASSAGQEHPKGIRRDERRGTEVGVYAYCDIFWVVEPALTKFLHDRQEEVGWGLWGRGGEGAIGMSLSATEIQPTRESTNSFQPVFAAWEEALCGRGGEEAIMMSLRKTQQMKPNLAKEWEAPAAQPSQ
ncbi:hypothetical protein BDK51DRAFT_28314 [Blyttiomyces helicus]|uniref:Uncharacterized protein n=1 Tax=Blyttiomyces helicus TaxID=388810 RepID=A0A4P9WRF0_9FUNG|nr:hypothetical protein BDK51DRAFT_28314 [Blyttiomyces helicus]|eukprot:RKO93840.1 hypothetical protein BDK51DRAFT_28314 [Blyttiomyces helicus]